MTEFFEVIERDGAARLGELRLDDPVETPAIANGVIEDAGSLWPTDRSIPDGRSDRVTVLPHRSFPRGTDQAVVEAFDVDTPEVDFPSATVVTEQTADGHDADVYLLGDAAGIEGHPRDFTDSIISLRTSIPDDTALYLPGFATPANVGLLAAVGVDLVDSVRAVVLGTQGRYLTTDGSHFLDDLEEYPCACHICRSTSPPMDRAACADHNVAALEAELKVVRERIRSGRLWDYVDVQVRHNPWLTATLRRFSAEWRYLEERVPIYRRATLYATTADVLGRVEIQRFADRVTSRYRNRFSQPLVLVPCSAKKPYSESQSHRQFAESIRYRAHVVSMTSPIGVVPQELELTYPAQHYDTPVTGDWKRDELSFVATVLRRYLDRNEYPRIIAHVPQGGYREICAEVEEELDISINYMVTDHPTTDRSLSALDSELDGELKYGKWERQRNTLVAIADYQFGEGAGTELFHDLEIQSRYPKLRAHTADGEQLAAMVPEYGTLALTIEGARRWHRSDLRTNIVEIEAFVPHGSVLAPGIVDADHSIRVGDEVIVIGPNAFGVGRAKMHGQAMVESTRGVAVDVRHVEDLT